MTDGIVVRRATPEDVPAMSRVLIESVTRLCTADHNDDPAAIASWTANKTPAGVLRMMATPGLMLFVAVRGGALAAVGAVTGDEVSLNYVAPEHRFCGVSRALLAAIEAEMHAAGVTEGRLAATTTARRFYLSAGWAEACPPRAEGFATCYPMRKRLGSAPGPASR